MYVIQYLEVSWDELCDPNTPQVTGQVVTPTLTQVI
jgi:hypothetical protein